MGKGSLRCPLSGSRSRRPPYMGPPPRTEHARRSGGMESGELLGGEVWYPQKMAASITENSVSIAASDRVRP